MVDGSVVEVQKVHPEHPLGLKCHMWGLNKMACCISSSCLPTMSRDRKETVLPNYLAVTRYSGIEINN